MGKDKKRKEEIQVLYALVDRNGAYSKIAGASICSLFENTKERVTVHLFHDGSIQGKNEENFRTLAKTYGQRLIFYNVRELLPEVWKEAREIFEAALQSRQYTEATLYRLVAPQVLPDTVKRLIYIDADTIVHIDIKKLWEEELGSNGMGAVRESTLLEHYGLRSIGGSKEPMYNRMKDSGLTMENCFNAGILLMDLSVIRPMGNLLLSGLRILAEYPEENRFYDQNILNYYFAKDLTPLPWYYNILQHWDRKHAEPKDVKGIYHYMGKTLGMNGYDFRDTLFYTYFLKTPWCDGEFFCRIHGVMNQVYLQMLGPKLRRMRRLAGILGRKCPVIAASAEWEKWAKQLLADPDSFDIDEQKEKEKKKRLGEAAGIANLATATDSDLKEVLERKAESGEREERDVEKTYDFPDGICHCSLGSEKEGLELQLPYDVKTHFYLIFVHDYRKVKGMLESAGLAEQEHYMDGKFLLAGKPWLEGIIQPQKFFEML